jgi:pSer/pThr/pTyr-binding forkhead associated (FHA) protein
MAVLRVLASAAWPGCEVRLADQPVTIGRGRANVIALLHDPRASLRHATVERCGAAWVVRDAGSTNGTWVNGERVAERALADGDQLQVGQTLVLFEEGGGSPSFGA